MSIIREPAVAGTFYPAGADPLRQEVGRYLAAASHSQDIAPKAIIVPHAGYVYSGPAAAEAYALLIPLADQIHRVILLGPNHRVALSGMALPEAGAFRTPLGSVQIDTALRDIALQQPGVITMDEAHREEHSLEVQLPFLQQVLNNFQLLPLVVGDTPPQQVSNLLEQLWGGSETLIVISSDLSHFHPYHEAQMLDQATSDAIMQFNGEAISYQHACGRNPVKGLLLSALQRHMSVKQLALCNSGDTAGSKDRVVGYGSYAFH